MVEEKEKILVQVEIEKLVEPREILRGYMDQEKMAELMRSMEMVGLIEPLVVKRVKGKYEIIAGHRRYLAAVKLGWKSVPCVQISNVYEYGDLMKLHENLYREDIRPIDESLFLIRLKEVMKCSAEKLAAMIGRSNSYVSERLGMCEWPSDVLKLVEDEVFPFSVGREFAKIDDDGVRSNYIRFAVEGGINPAVARKWKEAYQKEKLEKGAAEVPNEPPVSSARSDPQMFKCQVCDKVEQIAATVLVRICNPCYDVIKRGG